MEKHRLRTDNLMKSHYGQNLPKHSDTEEAHVHKYIQPYRQTAFQKPLIHVAGGLEICKSLKITRSKVFTQRILPRMRYVGERVKVANVIKESIFTIALSKLGTKSLDSRISDSRRLFNWLFNLLNTHRTQIQIKIML
jgi:hypothetical protein